MAMVAMMAMVAIRAAAGTADTATADSTPRNLQSSPRRKVTRSTGLLLLLCVTHIGCAEIMALSGPDEVDESVFLEGTPRRTVVLELGMPTHSESANDGAALVDTYAYDDGLGGRGARATYYLFTNLLFTPIVTQPLGIVNELQRRKAAKMEATITYGSPPQWFVEKVEVRAVHPELVQKLETAGKNRRAGGNVPGRPGVPRQRR
jgi:hypothetical protein